MTHLLTLKVQDPNSQSSKWKIPHPIQKVITFLPKFCFCDLSPVKTTFNFGSIGVGFGSFEALRILWAFKGFKNLKKTLEKETIF